MCLPALYTGSQCTLCGTRQRSAGSLYTESALHMYAHCIQITNTEDFPHAVCLYDVVSSQWHHYRLETLLPVVWKYRIRNKISAIQNVLSEIQWGLITSNICIGLCCRTGPSVGLCIWTNGPLAFLIKGHPRYLLYLFTFSTNQLQCWWACRVLRVR